MAGGSGFPPPGQLARRQATSLKRYYGFQEDLARAGVTRLDGAPEPGILRSALRWPPAAHAVTALRFAFSNSRMKLTSAETPDLGNAL